MQMIIKTDNAVTVVEW